MRMSRRAQPSRQQTGRTYSIMAPTRGWYVGENVANAKPGSALILRNWFPMENKLRMRRGSSEQAHGLAGSVASFLTYESGAVSKFFGVAGGSIHDISSPGAVGAAVRTGLTNSVVQSALLTTSGGTQYLSVVNGADDRLLYDGTTWGTTPAITGVASNTLIDVWVYANRLFFIQKNSLNVWYLPVDAIGGAAVAFPLAGVFQDGGYVMAGATWSTEDVGTGLDDKFVVMSSNGEVAVYSGANPAGTDWKLDGVYRIGRPLGRRCFQKMGGDLAIMTEDGLVPLSQAIQLDPTALAEKAVSRPIATEWRDAVKARTGLSGWQIKLWKRESMALIALPALPGDDRTQFIANVTTAAWASYEGWAGTCWEVWDNRLFFGTTEGRVIEAEIGGNDEGMAYSAAVMWTFDDFKAPAVYKYVQMARPMMESRTPISPEMSAQVEYVFSLPPAPSPSATPAIGALWDVAKWDEAVWPGGVVPYADWQGVVGEGTAIAMALQITNDTISSPDIFLNRLDVVYGAGGVLV